MTDVLVASAEEAEVPSLFRRLASFVYEGMLLFGILLVPGAIGALFVAVTGQQHSLQADLALQIITIAIYAAYFTWFWSVRGQTLPMQTWRIRVVTRDGQPLGTGRALGRYVASWLWVAPAMLIAALNHWPIKQELFAVGVGVAAYALLALLLPERQFLHDVLCRTRLVTAEPRQPS